MKKKINLKIEIFHACLFLIGLFIISLTFNAILLPNSLVVGGATGIGLVLNKLFDINVNLFVFVSGIFLLVISFIFLGFKKTRRNIAGTFLYPIMLSVTLPLANKLIPHLKFDDFIILVVLGGSCLGLGYGLVYKAGYSTGGLDIVMQLLNKYLKLPEGKASKVANMSVVVLATPVLGLANAIYSAITLIFEEITTNKITIGISDSKMFFVYTRKIDQIRDALVKKGDIGFTIMPTIGGYSHYKGEMIMCVVSTRDYYAFRELVLQIDKNAFFIINDCYEVNGGYKKQHLPFL